MSDNKLQLLSADELLGLSDQVSSDVEVTILGDKIVKFKPINFTDGIKIMSKHRSDMTEDNQDKVFVEYFADVLVEGIIEPVLTNEQKVTLKQEIPKWPQSVVERMMDQVFGASRLDAKMLEDQVKASEDFFEAEPESTES
jgi:hypothetical protein